MRSNLKRSGAKLAQRLLILGSLWLSACLGTIDTGPGLPQISSNFSESMRWSDFRTAALYLQPQVKEVFLEQFHEDPDLHIVDSRMVSVELNEAKDRARAEYVLEYYRLPSSRVKKWYWQQQWALAPGKLAKAGTWLIQNAPPELPWQE
jgi:hypothetical protein